MGSPMALDEAVAQVLAMVGPSPPEPVPPVEALGRVLASPLIADLPLPRFTHSAMDGFAVRAAETSPATPTEPVYLRVTGAVGAGHEAPVCRPGTAVRIATGATLPAGADAVVRVEEIAEHGDTIAVRDRVAVGRDIRARGEDLSAGDTVLAAGSMLGPHQVAAAASIGAGTLDVHRRPRVALVLTGDEVAAPGSEVGPHQVPDAIGPALTAWCLALGTAAPSPVYSGDDGAGLRSVLEAASDSADLVVTVGGVSLGHRDLVRDVVDEVVVAGVALRPGAPFAAGRVHGTPWAGLPGNPGAALVCFELFVRPALYRLAGRRTPDPVVQATLRGRIDRLPDRTAVWGARLSHDADGAWVEPTSAQGSASVRALADATAYIVIPPGGDVLDSGARVAVRTWSGRPFVLPVGGFSE